jgi:hypothetical protein
MTSLRSIVILLAILGLGACSDLSKREQKILSGGAIGAAGGAAIGALTGGSWVAGGLIGAAGGAAVGAILPK